MTKRSNSSAIARGVRRCGCRARPLQTAGQDFFPPADRPPRLAVLIPVYNHAATIGGVIAAAQALGIAVLVVDDGSTDGSGDCARAAGAEVMTLAHNQGKGCALRQGLHWAASRGYTAVLTCDADGQHPPPAVAALAAVASELPGHLVLGVRDMRSAPLASRIGRWWTSCGTWMVCGQWPGDNQTGLRIYPLPLAVEVPIRAGRYAYEVESLVRLIWAGAPLHRLTVPVLYPADRISHFRVGRDSLRAAATFCRLLALRLTRPLRGRNRSP